DRGVPAPAPTTAEDKAKTGSGGGPAPTPGPSAGTARPPVAQAPPEATANTEKARLLLQQGRKALSEKRYAQARPLAQQAKSLNPKIEWCYDTPEKLLADVDRAEPRPPAVAQKPGPDAKTDASATKPSDPHELLADGRQLYKAGKLDEAKQMALRANAV